MLTKTKTKTTERRSTQLDKHIGARIRMRRLELGMSQEALGLTLDLSFQQIQKYEKGVNRVGGGRMAAIAEALQVDVAFFYRGTGGADGQTPVSSVIDTFVASAQGARIAKAFLRIERHAAREAITNMVEALAGEAS